MDRKNSSEEINIDIWLLNNDISSKQLLSRNQLRDLVELGNFKSINDLGPWITNYIPQNKLDEFIDRLPSELENISISIKNSVFLPVRYVVYALICFLNSREIKKEFVPNKNNMRFDLADNLSIEVLKMDLQNPQITFLELNFKNVRVIAQLPTQSIYYLGSLGNFFVDIQILPISSKAWKNVYCISNFNNLEYRIFTREPQPLSLTNPYFFTNYLDLEGRELFKKLQK